MNTQEQHGEGTEPFFDPEVGARRAMQDAHQVLGTDQAAADADQTTSDADQTASDADQSASATDHKDAERDQRASDHDQAVADRERAAHPDLSPADQDAYDASRDERKTASVERFGTRIERANTARGRDVTATERDRSADIRDATGRLRDVQATGLVEDSAEPQALLLKQLKELAAQAAADRARAAADRARAAIDRANAARERARLEAELHQAHLDELTGAYRREMGQLTLSHEIDRARRSDGRFVLAFVDVDELKTVNDRDGHAAGDHVLQTVVQAIRTRLRSFDPIIRYGGDEFVCGLSGTDVEEAGRRFESISVAIEANARVGISVGFAALREGDTADRLTERADAAMLEIKARHHSRN